jgi:hypothetical protein
VEIHLVFLHAFVFAWPFHFCGSFFKDNRSEALEATHLICARPSCLLQIQGLVMKSEAGFIADDASLSAVGRSCSYVLFALLRIWELSALALASELPSTASSVAEVFTAEKLSVRRLHL